MSTWGSGQDLCASPADLFLVGAPFYPFMQCYLLHIMSMSILPRAFRLRDSEYSFSFCSFRISTWSLMIAHADPIALWLSNHLRVPKELISRFVKICPTCQVRRGGSRLTPPNSRRGSPRLEMVSRSPKLPSPPIVKRGSASSYGTDPAAQSDYLSQYHGHSHSHGHGHGTWMDPSSQSMQTRSSALTSSGMRSFAPGSGLNPTHSMTPGLDPFAEDMSMPPSQLGYATGYIQSHHGGSSSTHRDY